MHDHTDAPADAAASQPHDRPTQRPFAIALAITTTFLIAEIIGGLLTGSLALLADAGHMATDAVALGLALIAVWLARRPATSAHSFGYLRAEVLAALLNAALLIAISIFIFWEAFQRLDEPPEVDSGPMLVVAIAGLVANIASAWVLSRGGGHEHNLNTRGAFLHVVGDLLGSVGAIAAALVMLATGWYLVDPLLSAGIGVLILWGAWRLLRESVDVLLEATPKEIDPAAVRAMLAAIPGVSGAHDLHIWTVTSGFVALSSHIEVDGTRAWSDVLIELTQQLRQRFGIAHVTLQPEDASVLPGSFLACSLDSVDGRAACQVPFADAAQTAHRGHIL
jgi:cobalt-zinc-cadmium efflux system protein